MVGLQMGYNLTQIGFSKWAKTWPKLNSLNEFHLKLKLQLVSFLGYNLPRFPLVNSLIIGLKGIEIGQSFSSLMTKILGLIQAKFWA